MIPPTRSAPGGTIVSPPCEQTGTCALHDDFKSAVLDAIKAGSTNVEKLFREMADALDRRLTELYEEKIRLWSELGKQGEALAKLRGELDAVLRDGHPLRRAEDDNARRAALLATGHKDKRLPSLPLWAVIPALVALPLAGVGAFFLAVVIRDPQQFANFVKLVFTATGAK